MSNRTLRAFDVWQIHVGAEFCCPKCGGSSFGSYEHGQTLVRTCHGDDAGDGDPGCRFTWSEDEDERYFVAPDGRRFCDRTRGPV